MPNVSIILSQPPQPGQTLTFARTDGGVDTLTLPSLDDTYNLFVDSLTGPKSALALKLRYGNSMPWGTSKKAALASTAKGHPTGTAHVSYKQHVKNFAQLVKLGRIHLMSKGFDGAFYMPDFLLTGDGDVWNVNREAVAKFVAGGGARA